MFEPGAECPECNAKLAAGGCKECGWTATAGPKAPTLPPPAYREVPPPPAPPEHASDPTRCQVPACLAPGCEAYVRSQIAEGKRIAGSTAWGQRFGSQR